MENNVFISFLILCSFGFLWLLSPFFGVVFWAATIAIIFYPLFKNINNRLNGRKNTASLITLLTCCFILILPGTLAATVIIDEARGLIEKIQNDEIQPEKQLEKLEATLPIAESYISKLGISLGDVKSQLGDWAQTIGKVLTKNSLNIGKSTITFFMSLAVTLYIAFFFIRDGDKIVSTTFKAIPLGDDREQLLFDKFTEVTRATIKGNLLVALIQGAIGGLTFWLLGVESAGLWMFVMAIAAMIPVVGCAIVWVPVVIYFLFNQSYMEAFILTAVGAGIISVVDNILRPILVGKDTKLPDYIVLLATLGGLALFGLNGFIVGPLIAALFFVSWSIFMEEFET